MALLAIGSFLFLSWTALSDDKNLELTTGHTGRETQAESVCGPEAPWEHQAERDISADAPGQGPELSHLQLPGERRRAGELSVRGWRGTVRQAVQGRGGGVGRGPVRGADGISAPALPVLLPARPRVRQHRQDPGEGHPRQEWAPGLVLKTNTALTLLWTVCL